MIGHFIFAGLVATAYAQQSGSTVQQVAGGNLPSGPEAMAQAYNKYHKPAPNAVVEAVASATQSGTVKASPEPFDEAYLSPVEIGSQTFMLDFDTGSSDLWVFSKQLPKSQQGSHTLFDLSGTRESGETWDIFYGDGSGARGIVYADKVNIGGVTATQQSVEAATSVSSKFVSGLSDGLLGLGFDAGNTCSPKICHTFMDTVGPSLPQDLFTALLKKGAPGSYDFGFIDHSKYTGAIAYTKVNHAGSGNPTYWEFTSGGYAIGSGSKVVHSMDTIADTGTSIALIDEVIVEAFYAKIKGAKYSNAQGGYVFPCNAADLPTLSIYAGGARHTMPGSYAKYAPLGDGSGDCYGGVQSNTGIGFSILGDVFLKSQFVVFDLSVPRLGFAAQA